MFYKTTNMKKLFFTILLFGPVCHRSIAQIYFTKNGNVSFYSKSLLQDIEADNNQVISVLDMKTGALQFSLLNNAFQFPKAKMQADFNESYMESDRYPRSTFKGSIINIQSVDLAKDGSYPVEVKGQLTIHGVTKTVAAQGILNTNKTTITANSTFNVMVKDYGIKIPSIVSQKIAEQIRITVNCKYEKK